MGLKNKLSKAANLRSIRSLRGRPAKAEPAVPSGSEPATDPTPADPKWQFVVTSNPIKPAPSDDGAGTRDTSDSTATETADIGGTGLREPGAVEPTGWEWLTLPCWGGTTTEDRTCEGPRTCLSSCSDDGSCDSSVPSLSMLERVIDAPAATACQDDEDISDVTSAPSIDTVSTGEGDDCQDSGCAKSR